MNVYFAAGSPRAGRETHHFLRIELREKAIGALRICDYMSPEISA
jgi:hypothetical protein